MSEQRHLLLIECDDRLGLVAKFADTLFQQGLNILSNDEFVDPETSRFYMRTEVSGTLSEETLMGELQGIVPQAGQLRIAEKRPKRIVLMVTKEPHCIGDLLVRAEFNDMNASIEGVIGNHETLRPMVERTGLPFDCVSAKGLSREEHEAQVFEKLEAYDFDYLVLAKYMRILTPEFVSRYNNRIINIHHSFLPAFIGANPYRQAYERGVKVIGATAHFVNDSLDDGPIIAQDTLNIGHREQPDDMARMGRDVEKIVLARALKLVFEDRVFVAGNKTIIF